MLELRPSCEHCEKALPPDSTEAMICTFECTFCATCVTEVLANVCPNCGGGFCPRPIRPTGDWIGSSVNLSRFPAGTRVVHKSVDVETQAELRKRAESVPPEKR